LPISFPPRPPPHLALPSFPTRRSSDLIGVRRPHPLQRLDGTERQPAQSCIVRIHNNKRVPHVRPRAKLVPRFMDSSQHRADLARSESTRLNSSHSQISYAVFCLKKKNQ